MSNLSSVVTEKKNQYLCSLNDLVTSLHVLRNQFCYLHN